MLKMLLIRDFDLDDLTILYVTAQHGVTRLSVMMEDHFMVILID